MSITHDQLLIEQLRHYDFSLEADKIDPLSIELLQLSPNQVKALGKVTVPDIHVASTDNFNPDGIFSTSIFGMQGSTERMSSFGAIDLKIPILHPMIFDNLVSAKAFYKDIMAGNKYAKFNRETHLFEPSDSNEGSTGYSFFMKHVKQVTLEDTGSSSRRKIIKLVETKRKQMTMEHLLVVPAGLREYIVNDQGRAEMDEINGMYLSVISSAAFIPDNPLDLAVLDTVRFAIQMKVQEIYAYITNILYQKRGHINEKFIKRAVHGATRNVLTGLVYETTDVTDPRFIKDDESYVGLYQLMKACAHQCSHKVKSFMSTIMPSSNVDFKMVNPKTLKEVTVPFNATYFTKFNNYKGINKLINSLSSGVHNRVLKYKGFYFGLIYESEEKVMFLNNIEQLPDGDDVKYIRPMTIMDLLYLSCAEMLDKSVGIMTRYPVLNLGSVFPSKFRLKTTQESRTLDYYDVMGNKITTYARWPIPESGLFKTVSVTSSKLTPLGADFDGDMVSVTLAWSSEARAEIFKRLEGVEHWLDVTGNLLYSGENDFNKLTMMVLTRV
jgi:DNA-directed RNA polymerase beta' subunit